MVRLFGGFRRGETPRNDTTEGAEETSTDATTDTTAAETGMACDFVHSAFGAARHYVLNSFGTLLKIGVNGILDECSTEHNQCRIQNRDDSDRLE